MSELSGSNNPNKKRELLANAILPEPRNVVAYEIPRELSHLKEYLSTQSFAVRSQNIYQEVISSINYHDQRDNKDRIFDSEKDQFFEENSYAIDCGEFGIVIISAKTKEEQKFFQCEFLDESVKISDYDKKNQSAIVSQNENNYRLYLMLTKKVIDKNITLSLSLEHLQKDSMSKQFTVCTKNTIFELFPPFSSDILKR